MRIGLIDVDGHNYPNLPLMKLSAWHKRNGDDVDWYNPLLPPPYDRVYMSKVFSFTDDYPYCVNAKEIIKGGSGYCIKNIDGKEIFDKSLDIQLPYDVEHIMPDYSLYGITDTAYGFCSRGCIRGCSFCHVVAKEGKAHKVADLSEFWDGQKNIELMDPNTLACKEWKDILQQLIDSKAYVNFNQGVDIRLMTEEKAEMIKHIKVKMIHFAWDRYEDKDVILPKLKMFKEITGWGHSKCVVYILCNFNTTLEQDLERIYTVRDLMGSYRSGYDPYVMFYDKKSIPRGSIYNKLQRWVNNRMVFGTTKDFKDYTR